jgi:hypothetical protein
MNSSHVLVIDDGLVWIFEFIKLIKLELPHGIDDLN